MVLLLRIFEADFSTSMYESLFRMLLVGDSKILFSYGDSMLASEKLLNYF